jgi:coatomer subunit beta
VNTSAHSDLIDYVHYLEGALKVKLMTEVGEADQQAGFLVANFYTKSKFEEDCLINLSIEKGQSADGGILTGLIRVRAKTEGMALCVGEKCKAVK